MKIYAFSAELESAVIELLEDTTFLLSQLSNSDTPAYVKALRHLKATRPSVFQIRSTGTQIDYPGDKMMWQILCAREPKASECYDEPEVGKENLHNRKADVSSIAKSYTANAVDHPPVRCVAVAVKSE
jgi:hypothetical protein